MNFKSMSLLTDFYELTMMQGYFDAESYDRVVVFDVFYRINPSGNGFAIAVGLEQVIDYIKNLRYSPRTTWNIWPPSARFQRLFLTISGISASPATSMPFPKVRSYFRRSPLSG